MNGNHVTMLERIFGELVSDARQIRNFKFPVYRLIIVDAQSAVLRGASIDVVFVDHKIGDCGLYLKGCGSRQGAAACVNLNTNVKCKRHITNFFHLGDTAAGAQVRLNYLDSVLQEVFDVGCV